MLAKPRYGVAMAISTRQAAIFVSGLVVGAVVISGAWMLLGPSAAPTPATAKIAVAPPASVASASVPPPAQLAICPLQPAVAVAGEKDGRFLLQSDLSGNTAADTASFIVLGKEAAAAGRSRDAEVAFLMACRVADKLKGAGSVESADAKYQLGWHYEWRAQDAGSAAGASRTELLRRAELLYSDSAKAYLAKYGEAHEKSRFAADGLAAVRQTLAKADVVQPAPVPTLPATVPALTPVPVQPAQAPAARPTEPVAAARENAPQPSRPSAPKPQLRRDEPARAAMPTPQQPGVAARPSPSFDCNKARSTPEKLICSDAELARLDRELGRVYARAKNSTYDSPAFRRQNNEEWRWRESNCQKRECLLRWYAHRRSQLVNDINEAEVRASTGVSR